MDIFLATVAVALLSLIGVLIFGTQGRMTGTRRYIVPFAIGTFLGVIFLELIPETLHASPSGVFAIVGGFLGFYALSHILHTYHHHHHSHEQGHTDDPCHESKAGATLLLTGDAIHNFTDGIVITSAFLINPVVGWLTTLGVALHEVPQEIAEFGVLRHAGFSVKEAAFWNLISASSVVIGGMMTLVLAEVLGDYLWVLLGVAAGNLLFVAMSDLIPDVAENTRRHGRFVQSFLATIAGFLIIATLIAISHEKLLPEHDHNEEMHVDHDHEEEDHYHDEHEFAS